MRVNTGTSKKKDVKRVEGRGLHVDRLDQLCLRNLQIELLHGPSTAAIRLAESSTVERLLSPCMWGGGGGFYSFVEHNCFSFASISLITVSIWLLSARFLFSMCYIFHCFIPQFEPVETVMLAC